MLGFAPLGSRALGSPRQALVRRISIASVLPGLRSESTVSRGRIVTSASVMLGLRSSATLSRVRQLEVAGTIRGLQSEAFLGEPGIVSLVTLPGLTSAATIEARTQIQSSAVLGALSGVGSLSAKQELRASASFALLTSGLVGSTVSLEAEVSLGLQTQSSLELATFLRSESTLPGLTSAAFMPEPETAVVFQFANFAESRLAYSIGPTDGILRIPPQDSDRFPQPDESHHRFALVLTDGQQMPEIVWCRRNFFGDLIVDRAKEKTDAKHWRAGTLVMNAPTAASLGYVASGGQSGALLELEAKLGLALARIATLAQVIVTDQDAFALYQQTVTAKFDESQGSINTLSQAFADLNSAWAEYQVLVTASTALSSARALQALTATVTNSTSLVTLQTFLRATVGDPDDPLSVAEYNERIQAFADFDEAQTTINLDLGARIGANEAGLASEIIIRADADGALASRIDQFTASTEVDIGALTARLATEETARATADGAMTTRLDQADSKFAGTLGSTLLSRITTEETTRASETGTLASRASTLESQFSGATGSVLLSRIATEESTRSSADSTLASRSTTLESQFAGTTGSPLLSKVTTIEGTIAGAGGLDAWWEKMAIAGTSVAGIRARAQSEGGSTLGIIGEVISLYNSVAGVAEQVLQASGGNVYIRKKLYLGTSGEIELDPEYPAVTWTRGAVRLAQGAGIGVSADLVMWFGPSSIGVPSMTKANSIFALATDGKVYYGGTELDPGGGATFFAEADRALAFGSRTTAGMGQTAVVNIKISNAKGAVSYDWAGDAGWTVYASSAASTGFGHPLTTPGEQVTGTQICRVHDAGSDKSFNITVRSAVIYNI